MELRETSFFLTLIIILASIAVHFFVCLANSLTTHNWIFLNYFDDQKNYVESFSELSLFPLSFNQLVVILSHVGVNVYEPVGIAR